MDETLTVLASPQDKQWLFVFLVLPGQLGGYSRRTVGCWLCILGGRVWLAIENRVGPYERCRTCYYPPHSSRGSCTRSGRRYIPISTPHLAGLLRDRAIGKANSSAVSPRNVGSSSTNSVLNNGAGRKYGTSCSDSVRNHHTVAGSVSVEGPCDQYDSCVLPALSVDAALGCKRWMRPARGQGG